MRDDFKAIFPKPPREYDPSYVDGLVRQLTDIMAKLQSVGPISVSAINISDLPTSATGLRPGDLWNDLGTVKIVT